jgi:hypothetical protein
MSFVALCNLRIDLHHVDNASVTFSAHRREETDRWSILCRFALDVPRTGWDEGA